MEGAEHVSALEEQAARVAGQACGERRSLAAVAALRLGRALLRADSGWHASPPLRLLDPLRFLLAGPAAREETWTMRKLQRRGTDERPDAAHAALRLLSLASVIGSVDTSNAALSLLAIMREANGDEVSGVSLRARAHLSGEHPLRDFEAALHRAADLWVLVRRERPGCAPFRHARAYCFAWFAILHRICVLQNDFVDITEHTDLVKQDPAVRRALIDAETSLKGIVASVQKAGKRRRLGGSLGGSSSPGTHVIYAILSLFGSASIQRNMKIVLVQLMVHFFGQWRSVIAAGPFGQDAVGGLLAAGDPLAMPPLCVALAWMSDNWVQIGRLRQLSDFDDAMRQLAHSLTFLVADIRHHAVDDVTPAAQAILDDPHSHVGTAFAVLPELRVLMGSKRESTSVEEPFATLTQEQCEGHGARTSHGAVHSASEREWQSADEKQFFLAAYRCAAVLSGARVLSQLMEPTSVQNAAHRKIGSAEERVQVRPDSLLGNLRPSKSRRRDPAAGEGNGFVWTTSIFADKGIGVFEDSGQVERAYSHRAGSLALHRATEAPRLGCGERDAANECRSPRTMQPASSVHLAAPQHHAERLLSEHAVAVEQHHCNGCLEAATLRDRKDSDSALAPTACGLPLAVPRNRLPPESAIDLPLALASSCTSTVASEHSLLLAARIIAGSTVVHVPFRHAGASQKSCG